MLKKSHWERAQLTSNIQISLHKWPLSFALNHEQQFAWTLNMKTADCLALPPKREEER